MEIQFDRGGDPRGGRISNCILILRIVTE